MNLCDAHCHLANLAETMPLQALLDEAAEHNITHFLSAALSKSELKYQQQLATVSRSKLLFSAGIHPNFEPCDLEYRDIEELCNNGLIWAIGEIGLDRGNPEYALMRETFIRQLDLALNHRLPVVLHIVGHQQEAFDILRSYPLKFLIHGYAGSIDAFRTFMRLDSYFTISERILKEAYAQRDTIMKEAKELKDKIVNEAKDKAQSEADRIVASARENIQTEKAAAMAEIKGQVAAISIDLAERVLKSELSDKAKHNKLVENLLADIQLN